MNPEPKVEMEGVCPACYRPVPSSYKPDMKCAYCLARPVVKPGRELFGFHVAQNQGAA